MHVVLKHNIQCTRRGILALDLVCVINILVVIEYKSNNLTISCLNLISCKMLGDMIPTIGRDLWCPRKLIH